MNSKGSQLFFPIEDLTIQIPDGNALADYFPALQPILENGEVLGSEPSTDLSVYNRVRYSHLSDNPYKYTDQESIDHLTRTYQYQGEIVDLQNRDFHILPIVVEDIHAWTLVIDQLRIYREQATGRTIPFPEGRLINGIVKVREFHEKDEL